jgi:TusA-related sulfurtransferase/rhodanese-related sulfurtransferase
LSDELNLEKKSKVDTKIVSKTLKLWVYSIFHLGRWYLPNIPEIKPDQLYDKIKSNEAPLLIDIREESDIKKFGMIEKAKLFPYFNFLSQVDKIPENKETEIVTICPGGGASLVIAEVLLAEGYKNVKSLKGGIKAWRKKKFPLVELTKNEDNTDESLTIEEKYPFLDGKNIEDDDKIEISYTVNARNLSCPLPVLQSKKAIKMIEIGQVIEIFSTDPGSLRDIPAWAKNTHQEFISYKEIESNCYRYLIRKLQ